MNAVIAYVFLYNNNVRRFSRIFHFTYDIVEMKIIFLFRNLSMLEKLEGINVTKTPFIQCEICLSNCIFHVFVVMNNIYEFVYYHY